MPPGPSNVNFLPGVIRTKEEEGEGEGDTEVEVPGEGGQMVDGSHPWGMTGCAPSAGNTAILHVSAHHKNSLESIKQQISILGRYHHFSTDLSSKAKSYRVADT